MKTRSYRMLSALFLTILFLSGPAGSRVYAQDDATPTGDDSAATKTVADYRSETRLKASIFGPERGSLTHDADVIAFAPAGITVRSFFAKIRVTAPYDGADQLWDAGFVFRSGRDTDWRVVIYSDGSWDVRLGSGDPLESGEIPDLKSAAGDANDIELVVDGNIGLLAINGDEVGSFDVSRRGVSGDVAFGVTFTEDAVNIGAETPYARYQIWELEDEGAPPISRAARSLMEKGRDVADTGDPLSRALSGSLDETAESITINSLNVTVADFYAKVEVTNPRDGEDHPFDFGLGFRDTGGDVQYRLIIASNGSWYLKIGVDPLIAGEDFAGLNTGVGDTNLLEMVASGDQLAFAINGDVIGEADISDLTDPGDIAFGVGFYPDEDIVEGASTSFKGLSAWALEGGTTQPTEEAVTPEITVEVVTREATEEAVTPEPTEEVVTPETTKTSVSTDPEEAFSDYVAQTDSLEILFGPDSGTLDHQSDSITYADSRLDVVNFIAHAEWINPYPASGGSWDVGFLFRLGAVEPHFRLIVVSTGDWYLTPSTGEPLDQGTVQGLRLGNNQHNTIDLVVVGDTGYFGINGLFVAKLDLSEVSQSGDVAFATSFFQGNFKEGATTGYEDFIVWGLEGEATTPVPTEEATTEAGNVYESPTYGYKVTYDDSWTIENESSDQDTDSVRFSNGVSTVDFTSFESSLTVAACLDDEFSYYQTADGYTNAQVALDVNNNEMQGTIEDIAWSVYWFTFTPQGGDATDYTAYVECRPLEAGVSLLRIVQFVVFDSYNDEIQARVDLIGGLTLAGSTPDVTVTAELKTPTNGDETPVSGDKVVVQVDEVDDSGVQGLATVQADGSRSSVRVLAIGAEDGTIALIQEGTCADLSGTPAYLLNTIEGGASETTVRASFVDLTSGDYAITFHESLDDLTAPLSCGEISG